MEAWKISKFEISEVKKLLETWKVVEKKTTVIIIKKKKIPQINSAKKFSKIIIYFFDDQFPFREEKLYNSIKKKKKKKKKENTRTNPPPLQCLNLASKIAWRKLVTMTTRTSKDVPIIHNYVACTYTRETT